MAPIGQIHAAVRSFCKVTAPHNAGRCYEAEAANSGFCLRCGDYERIRSFSITAVGPADRRALPGDRWVPLLGCRIILPETRNVLENMSIFDSGYYRFPDIYAIIKALFIF